MALNMERIRISNGVNLNIVKTNKFKSNLINIYFIRPLNREEVTTNALLPLVLKRGTKRFNTLIDIEKQLEEMYGASLAVGISKAGEKQIMRFSIEGVNPDYVENKDMLSDMFKMVNEIINNPYIEDNGFKSKYVKQEKERLSNKISNRINDKKTYASEKCLETMCSDEPYSIYKFGYEEDFDDITPTSLYEHYQKVLKTSRIEIFVIGDVSQREVENEIREEFKFEIEEPVELPREKISKDIKEVTKISDKMDVVQGKLSMGYRVNVPYEDELYDAFIVGNNILGGGTDSKLFLNVREKESLAYYTYSRGYKFKSIMMIDAGVESDKMDKVIDISNKQVESVKNGEFEDNDIKIAKNSIITSIKSMYDDPYSISEFFFTQALSKSSRSLRDIISSINKIDKESIVKSFQNIQLDSIYMIVSNRDKEE
ncbi:pitrilysin family protein [Clostridiaceae bacterium M8S5]|nr:pitrilysin family protein [Clostridiaceae bacterium M8S5]